jgi:hypothetical protein
MPQLDIYSIYNQSFWGILLFGLWYCFSTFFIVPSIYTILFARNHFLTTSKKSSFDLLSLALVHHTFFAVNADDFMDYIPGMIEDVVYHLVPKYFFLLDFYECKVHKRMHLKMVFKPSVVLPDDATVFPNGIHLS